MRKEGLDRYLFSHMLDQLPRIPFPSRTRLSTQIHKVIGIIITMTKRLMFSIVKEWHEFFVEALVAFGGELVPGRSGSQ